MTYRNIFW
jgi:hypothetical protein